MLNIVLLYNDPETKEDKRIITKCDTLPIEGNGLYLRGQIWIVKEVWYNLNEELGQLETIVELSQPALLV